MTTKQNSYIDIPEEEKSVVNGHCNHLAFKFFCMC